MASGNLHRRDCDPARSVRRWRLACGLVLALVTLPIPADEVSDALAATAQSHRAARESQQRIDRIAAEIRKLHQQQQDTRGRVLQLSVYAAQLEEQAQTEEQGRSGLEAQIAGIRETEAGLLPLAQRMVADLDRFVQADLPFQVELRRRRVQELQALLEDSQRSTADKFRRVLDAWRSEVDYGYSLGVEEVELTLEGRPVPVAVVRIGRVGLYYLSADGARAGYWNTDKKGWRNLESDSIAEVTRALKVARGEMPPELLVLPVAVP